jgi:hypothetical protein
MRWRRRRLLLFSFALFFYLLVECSFAVPFSRGNAGYEVRHSFKPPFYLG